MTQVVTKFKDVSVGDVVKGSTSGAEGIVTSFNGATMIVQLSQANVTTFQGTGSC